VGGPSLVGREVQLARLRRALDDAAGGAGGLVLVCGEAGSGKTALVEAALAGQDVARTAWGTCREGAGVPGFWPWVEIVRELELTADAGTEVVGDLFRFGGEDGPNRFGLFDATGLLLRRISEARPFVLVLDDLQWADAGSLRLLAFLAPDLRRRRLLVVGAYRDDEVDDQSHPLHTLIGGLAARAVTIAEIGRAHV